MKVALSRTELTDEKMQNLLNLCSSAQEVASHVKCV
jgi:hypothetical protein